MPRVVTGIPTFLPPHSDEPVGLGGWATAPLEPAPGNRQTSVEESVIGIGLTSSAFMNGIFLGNLEVIRRQISGMSKRERGRCSVYRTLVDSTASFVPVRYCGSALSGTRKVDAYRSPMVSGQPHFGPDTPPGP